MHVGQEFPEAPKRDIAFDIAIDLGIMKIYIWSPTMYYTGPAHRRSGLGFKVSKNLKIFFLKLFFSIRMSRKHKNEEFPYDWFEICCLWS